MRWLDTYIDRIYATTPRLGTLSPPFTRVGSAVNVVMCSVIAGGGIALSVTGKGIGLLMIPIAAFLLTVFIRIAVRAFRGDFDRP